MPVMLGKCVAPTVFWLCCSLGAAAQDYGGCAESFAKLQREGATIAKIQGIFVDHANRRISYATDAGELQVPFPPGKAELDAIKRELDAVGKSWLVRIGRQAHYAQDDGDGCLHYPVSLIGSPA